MRWITTGESEKFRGNSNLSIHFDSSFREWGGCGVAAAATLQSLRERKRKVTMSDT